MADADGAASAAPTYVLFDLDGLILDTETLCVDVARQVVARYGKQLTLEAKLVALGKRPLECWRDIAKVLGIDAPAEQLLGESEPLLIARWHEAPLLPGALRLLRHLHRHGVPFAIATSTPRATFDRKVATRDELRQLLTSHAVVCGDEVPNGKPAPDVFLAAAAKLGAAPGQCVVLEDAPSGVQGATAAGCRVVVVPSIVGCVDYPPADPAATSGVVEVLPSLLAFQPGRYGLPPMDDLIQGATPMLDTPIRIRGTVVKGFGRGSKELGIPTANVDSEALAGALAEAVTGVYGGWARIGADGPVHKMCMSIGFNPHFGNTHKTAEPWILAEFDKPFYGEEVALVVCLYIRPEVAFTSLQALVERIHEDAAVTRVALDAPHMQAFAQDAFFNLNSQPKPEQAAVAQAAA